jgi:hypothetical protein
VSGVCTFLGMWAEMGSSQLAPSKAVCKSLRHDFKLSCSRCIDIASWIRSRLTCFLFLQNVVDHNGKLRQHPAYRLVKIVRQEATHARSEPEREGTF